ncbi:hypothetical protein [Aureimonas populi]|uniref:Class IIb bacteriocin, lactobin A/cerein 7B family n=1 Tax=Aureimonas populi TaxID=1701758 RepID=A0ABW5CKA7_9HYPH|nr:hypothetical protein [Aureimonas populi]
MRELTNQELETVNGAAAPLLFVAAVALSRVSAGRVATYVGAQLGAAGYFMTQ